MADELKLPLTSLREPEMVPSDFQSLLFVNSPYVGSCGQIGQNNPVSPLQSSLDLAQYLNAVVVMSGSILYLTASLYNWGINTPRRMAVHKDDLTNPDLVDYPESVVRQETSEDFLPERDPHQLLTEKKPVYLLRKERFVMLLQELSRFFYLDDEQTKEKYSFPVYFVLDPEMIEFALRLTIDEIRQTVKKEQSHVRIERRELMNILAKTESLDLKDALVSLIDDLTDYLSRVLMSNINPEYVKDLVRKYQKWLIDQIEKAIPYSRVVGFGSAFLCSQGKVIEVARDISKTPLSETSSDSLASVRNRVQGEIAQGQITADLVLVAGGNPSSEMTYTAGYWQDVCGHVRKKTVPVMTLPPCTATHPHSSHGFSQMRPKTPLTRIYQSPQYSPGCQVLDLSAGIPRYLFFSSEFLVNPQIFPQGKDASVPSWKWIYLAGYSDSHLGMESQLIETPTSVELCFSLLQKFYEQFVPGHLLLDLGDTLQGDIHEAALNEVPHEMPTATEFLRDLQSFQEPITREKILQRYLLRFNEPTLERQFRLWQGAVNIKLHQKVLQRARKARLDFVRQEGMQTFSGGLDLTIEGNHTRNSTRSKVRYAQRIAESVQGYLCQKVPPGWSRSDWTEWVLTQVQAPMHGDFGYVSGVVLYRGKKLFALQAQHDLGSSRGNPMRAVRRTAHNIGSHFIYSDQYRIICCGHTHVGGISFLRNSLLVQYPAVGQSETSYGKAKGFPVSINGATVAGFPVRGIAWGPITIVNIFVDDLWCWANYLLTVLQENLFPNPV